MLGFKIVSVERVQTTLNEKYSVSLSIWIYMVLYLFTIDVIHDHVKLLMFYTVQTTNLTFVGRIWEYSK